MNETAKTLTFSIVSCYNEKERAVGGHALLIGKTRRFIVVEFQIFKKQIFAKLSTHNCMPSFHIRKNAYAIRIASV